MLGQRELGVQDYKAILRRRWLIIVFLAVVGCGLGYGVTHFIPKKFTSTTLVLVEQPTVPGDYVKPVVSGDTSQRLASMQQEIMSRARLEPVIQQLGLYRDLEGSVPMGDLVDDLRKSVSVAPISPMAETQAQGLPGFYVNVTFGDPRTAQQICSTITSMFMEENLKLRQAQAQQTTKFLGNQLVDAKAKLDEQDARLADFKRRYLGSLPDEEQANLNILTGLTAQLDATTQALNRAQQDRTFTDSMLAQQTANWEAGQNGKNPETLEAELATLQAQLATLKSKYTDNYPDVVRVKNDIAAVEQKIAAETDDVKTVPTEKAVKNSVEPAQMQSMRGQIRQYDQTIKELTARQEGVQQQIKQYEGRVQSSPAIEQQYKELTRDYQTALEFYNDLLKKRDQSAMATDLEQSQQGEQFQVLDPANLPDSPSYPKKLLFSLGGLAGGLGLGVALSLFMELKDTTFRSEKDVEALLHLPVLAMVPAIKLSEGNKAVGPSGLLDRA